MHPHRILPAQAIINRAWWMVTQCFAMIGQARGGRLNYRAVPVAVLLLAAHVCVFAQDTLPIVSAKHPVDLIDKYEVLDGPAGFGSSCATLGDLNADGIPEIAVCVARDSLSPPGNGAVYIIQADPNLATLNGEQVLNVIRSGSLGFITLDTNDLFAGQVTAVGDVNDDGIPDMAVLASGSDRFTVDGGVVYLFFLDHDGTIKEYHELNTSMIADPLQMISGIGDQNGDDIPDLLIGTPSANGAGPERGAIHFLHLKHSGDVLSTTITINDTLGWVGLSPLMDYDGFGLAATALGDLDGDGNLDLAVTTMQHDGPILILYLNDTGAVKAHHRILCSDLGVSTKMGLGRSIVNVGDLNGDGVVDIAAGTPTYNPPPGAPDEGGVLMIYLDPTGIARSSEFISNDDGSGETDFFDLQELDRFGEGLTYFSGYTAAKDLAQHLVVGAPGHGPGGQGAAWSLRLQPKPVVAISTIIEETDSTYGRIDLDIQGGVRPYTLLWGKDFPSEAAFDSVKSRFAEYDWASIGMPKFHINSFTWEQLREATTPDLEALQAGTYDLTIVDQRGDTTHKDFKVGFEITSTELHGGEWDEENAMIKTAPTDSWTNMMFMSGNSLDPGNKGIISFMIADTTNVVAVGIRPFGALKVNGYEHMAFAYVIEHGHVSYWYDGQLHDSGETFLPPLKPNFALTVDGGAGKNRVEFSWEGHSHFAPFNPPLSELTYLIDIELYTADAAVLDLFSDFSGGSSDGRRPDDIPIKVIPHVTHISCNGEKGFVELGYSLMNDAHIGWTFRWWRISENAPTLINEYPYLDPTMTLNPGQYMVEVLGMGDPTYAYRTYYGSAYFEVGYKADWIEKAYCHTPSGEPNTLVKDNVFFPSGRASTSNRFAGGNTAWLSFKVPAVYDNSQPWVCAMGTEDLITGTQQPTAFVVRFSGARLLFLLDPTPPFPLSYLTIPPNGAHTIRMHYIEGLAGIRVQLDFSSNVILHPYEFAHGIPRMRAMGLVSTPGAPIENALCSFPCSLGQRALMADDLEDGYHRATRKVLRCGYQADYYYPTSAGLEFAIHDATGAAIITSASYPVHQGYNELEFSLTPGGTEIPTGFYWLEVTDQKGLKQYLRFHYEHTAQ